MFRQNLSQKANCSRDTFVSKRDTSPYGELPELNGPINRETQGIESWLKKVPKSLTDCEAYDTLGGYADAVKLLLSVEDIEFDLSMLLMLAKHPSCNLSALFSFGQSFNFGWGQTVDVTLEMYLFINIVGNTSALLGDSKYASMKDVQNLVIYETQLGYRCGLGAHKQ